MHERLRDWLLDRWAKIICQYPKWILAAAAALLAGCVWLTLSQLTFQADRNELISRELEWNQWFIDWRTRFSGQNDLFVVVDVGQDKHSGQFSEYQQQLAAARAVVDELAEQIGDCDAVAQVVWGFPGSDFSPRALRLDHWEAFEAFVRQMEEGQLLLASETPGAFLEAVMGELGRRSRAANGEGMDAGETAAAIDRLGQVIHGFTVVLDDDSGTGPGLNDLALGEDNPLTAWRYMESPNGRLLFLRVTPKRVDGVINAPAIAIGQVRQAMDAVRQIHPEMAFGLTGIEVVEADETAAATRDSVRASILAVVLIAVLLVCAFQSLRMPLLLIAALLVGVGWSFGFLTLTIGHLQVISVVFTVILLGLGIAFGIHIASCFEMLRHQYEPGLQGFTQALTSGFRTVGPGVVTGAVTTAVAFCMTLMTDFVGVAEMGLIAGVGVLLCLAAMLTVFPALLRMFRTRSSAVVPLDSRRVKFFDERWVGVFVRHPKMTLAVAFVLTGLSILAAMQMTYDFDLLKLQPENVDSVIWQERIVKDGEQSIWAATTLVDSLEEARELTRRFMAQPHVASVTGIGWLMPDDDARKLARLQEAEQLLRPGLNKTLGDGDEVPTGDGAVVDKLVVMRVMLAAAKYQPMPQQVRDALNRFAVVIERMVVKLQAMDAPSRQAALERLQKSFTQWRKQTAAQIAVAVDGELLEPKDLSPKLLEPYMAAMGEGKYQYALEIHPKLPEGSDMNGPLDPEFLPVFMRELESIDPQVTGVIAQVYRSGDLIKRSYVMAGWLALGAVFLLVLIDFRSIGDALLCLMPVAVGFAITFGAMWVIGMKINPANIIVLPLMFGIGVDAGVHVLHRHRHDPTTRPLGLTHGTGKGITVTSLTSMIGFGVMLLGNHRGIRSLGFVMFVGIGMTMLACWTVMPAWLEVVSRRRDSRK